MGSCYPILCPYCGSDDLKISINNIDIDWIDFYYTYADGTVRCKKCGKRAKITAWFGFNGWTIEDDNGRTLMDHNDEFSPKLDVVKQSYSPKRKHYISRTKRR